MRSATVAPTGVERTFADDEIIVSKTDPKGIITYANDVFVRVSAYSEDELLGQPHNIIRHPDMPRAVFRLLWDTLQTGHEIFGYVLNLAADGAHYWVLAHVTPTVDGSGRIVGYHSNRRTPNRDGLEQIKPVYEALLAEERKHRSARDAVEASVALLGSVLGDLGVSYDEFVWSLVTGRPTDRVA
jgi:PAS domain S-box-containing protein